MSQQIDAERTESRVSNRQSNAAVSSQVASVLLDGEEVIVDARPAWSAWGVHLLIAGLIFLGGIAGDSVFAGAFVALVIVGYVWFQRSKVQYLVTDRRIVVLTGFSSKATNETWMEDVRGMQTGASLIERLLGHGHITVSHTILPTAVGRFKGLTLGGVANYEEIADVIRSRQSERKAGEY